MDIFTILRMWVYVVTLCVFCYQLLSSNKNSIVGGIMVENESNIYIANKIIKFDRDVCFDILIEGMFGPT